MGHRFARRVLLSIPCLLVMTLAALADIRFEQPEWSSLKVFITEKITASDANQLAAHEQDLQQNLVHVYLNSLGGDVDAAMAIGRLIRKYDGWTYIGDWLSTMPLDSKCFSSCALIFIAGVRRTSTGPGYSALGINRI